MPVDITKLLIYGYGAMLVLAAVAALLIATLHAALRLDVQVGARATAIMKQTRNALTGLLTIVIAISLAIILFEMVLRFTTRPDNPPGFTQKHPTRGYSLRPGYVGHTYDAPLEINSRGIRGPNREIQMGSDALRIVVLGDSMTYGVGVSAEEAYPMVLERSLQKQHIGPVQVFNLGVPSYNTLDEAIALEETWDIYKPDLVILQFMVNNDVTYKPRPRPQIGFKNTRLWQLMREVPMHSYALHWTSRHIKLAIYRLKTRNAQSDALDAFRLGVNRRMVSDYNDNAPGWIEAQDAIGRIQRFLREKNTPFVFAINVDHTHLSKEHREILKPLVDRVVNAVTDLGITPVLILDEAFDGFAGRENELYVRPDDVHWNALAHTLVSAFLLKHLQKTTYLSERSNSSVE